MSALTASALAAGALLFACAQALAQAAPATGKDSAEIRRMEKEQEATLRQIKDQLARLPEDPPPRPDEPPEVKERRERKAKLHELVRELERRISAEKSRALPSKEAESAYTAYYKRVTARIEQAAAKEPPKRGDTKLYGSAILRLTLGLNGEIEELGTDSASSPEFALHLQSLVRSLAPFEPLSPAMRKHVDRIAISTRVSYAAQ